MGNETDFTTQQNQTPKNLRLPQTDEDGKRQKDRQPSPQTRAQKADSLSFRLPKSARILSSPQYQKILRNGKRLVSEAVAIDYRKGGAASPKLGITVSKRYGKAHDRNRFKRAAREVFRQTAPSLLPGIEVNVSPRLPLNKMERGKVASELRHLLAKII